MENGNYNPYNDIKVIYDDEYVSIYEVMTSESAQYFGGGDYGVKWDRLYRNGDLYFIVDKIGDEIYSIFNQNGEPTEIYDVTNHENIKDPKKIYKIFPQLKSIIDDMLVGGDAYQLLKRVKSGYDPGWSIRNNDDLLYSINFNEKNPGLSKVTIRFSDIEEYLSLFDDRLDDDDKYYFNLYNNSYYEPDYDRYRLSEDWNEGYIYPYLNDENKKLLDNIGLILSGGEDLPTSQMMVLIAEYFDDETEEISRDWFYYEDSARVDIIKKNMDDEISNKFINFGIKEKYPHYEYETSVNILLRLLNTFGDKISDIKTTLKKIIDKYDTSDIGYWSELYWNIDIGNKFDDESFNRDASYVINKMITKISDDEKYVSFEEYIKIIDIIKNKYGFDKWIVLKKDNNLKYKINSVDPATNKLNLTIENIKTGKSENRLMSLEDIPQLEYQYELFNENRKTINEDQSDKLNNKIRSTVEKFGFENALKIFGGNKDIIRRAYEDNPSSFLNQFNNLKPVVNDDRIYYVDENNKPLFYYYQDDENGYCYINFWRIWSFFEDVMDYSHEETEQLIKKWLKETYNLGGLTPLYASLNYLLE
jgi:hypothetical protein